MTPPLVSCIIPTANREQHIPFAINCFLEQDYPNAELIIVDDGKKSAAHLIPDHPLIWYYYTAPMESIGAKRNFACKKAIGQIIIHWDDDAWRAKNWISAQVHFLFNSGADLCGIQNIRYYSVLNDQLFTVMRYAEGVPNPLDWVHVATLAYWKSFWETHSFEESKLSNSDDFFKNPRGNLFIHNYIDGFIIILPSKSTMLKKLKYLKIKHKTNGN